MFLPPSAAAYLNIHSWHTRLGNINLSKKQAIGTSDITQINWVEEELMAQKH